MASSMPTVPSCTGAPATGTTPTVSPEETNFLRFVNLILKRAPKALRVHFDTVHPPNNLVTDLATQRPTLLSLKARKVINQVQWDTLFGVPNPLSRDFDATLLICLLRNMSPSTQAPRNGFDNLPNQQEVSDGADIARIKFYRNRVAHSTDARMNTSEFNASWTDVEGAIGRLGGSALLNEAKALRFSPIDESERELVLELFLKIKQLMMEQSETIPWNIRELIKEKLKSWEEEDKVFVEINASVTVENFIKEHPCVVVVGHPGSGKSAIIHHIALKMGKQGFSIIPINRPEEIMTFHDRRNQQVFVVDDPCGEYSVNDQANEWARYSEDIMKCLNFKQNKDQVQSKLLVSCRLVISSTRAIRRIKVFSNTLFSLEKQENHLTFIERKLILESHLKCELHFHKGIFEKHIDCFPLLCKLYVNIWADPKRWISFFDNPFSELVSMLDLLVDDPKPESIYEYCSLVCCSLAEDKLNLYLSNAGQNEVFEYLHQMNEDYECLYEIHEECKIDLNPSELLSALKRQSGKYVKHVGSTFSLTHSKLLDIIVWHFGKQSPETLIRFSSLEIFQNRLRPLGRLRDDDNGDLFFVELDENMLPFYTKRIQKDISQGLVSDTFKNPCMPNAKIEICLYDLLVDEHVLEETLLKTSNNLPSNYIKAYNSFSKEDLLGNSRVTFLHLTIIYNWAAFVDKLFESENEVLFKTMFEQRASTLHLAILSENIQILKRCFQYYSEVFCSLGEFIDFGMENDDNCLFCETNLKISSHDVYCPVVQVPIPLLVCITGNLEILEYLIQIKVCSQNDFLSNYQLFDETVSPLLVASLYGHCSLVCYLLQLGASVNYQNQDGISPLHAACQSRQLEVIKILISNEARVNLRDEDGETPLSLSCTNDFVEIVAQLLCNGAEINLQDSQGLTPLHKSIMEGHVRTVQFLIESECDINIISNTGDTPLSLACLNGDCDILKLLIKKGINSHQLQDGMQKACIKGNKDIISILLEYGAEINAKSMRGFSALHISCANDNSDLVAYLFSNGALANISSDNKQTPLHFAAKNLSDNCLSILLKNGADINVIDDKGRTAFHYALEATCSEKNHQSDQIVLKKLKRITDIFIENKMDLKTTDLNGRSLLHIACSGFFPEIVQTLIHNQLNINAFDKEKCTPLHIACFACRLLPVQLFTENEGNINATNVRGSSPQHLACLRGNFKIVSTLVAYGAKVNISDKAGSTPLHIAIEYSHRDVIFFLISQGANINASDDYGFTPLILCCQHNNKDVVEELLKSGADINMESNRGINTLTMAITFQRYDICDLLYEKGAYLHEKNYRHLLQLIVSENDICKILDKYRSTIAKFRNKEGQSLLHLATIDNNVCWVSSLLSRTELINAVDNKGQSAFVYAIYHEFKSIVKLFLERCTSGDAISAELQNALFNFHIFFETLFRIGRIQFGELEIVFDIENHDTVRTFMRYNAKKCNLKDLENTYGSRVCHKIITGALKQGRYFDLYNIILAKLPDEIWNLHKSKIPCLCPELGKTSRRNWIKQEEILRKSFRNSDLDSNFFELEVWPLLFLGEEILQIMKQLMKSKRKGMDFFSNTDAIGNTLMHYVLLASPSIDMFDLFIRDIQYTIFVKEFLNRQNLAGCTPLYYALCSPFNISTLIEWGADIDIKDTTGRDVLHYAKACDLKDTIEILERHLTTRSKP
ncbi:uncharacterized protein LOC134272844 [Saccostrea cucullata]|uniref:uncharacterized protein LOC134272844 n=1 Tax=Saccostrea cuccullata TaxID=36930 RepID=UPI002ED3F269